MAAAALSLLAGGLPAAAGPVAAAGLAAARPTAVVPASAEASASTPALPATASARRPAPAAVPAPGRYAGELCVATRPEQAASCGPAEIELRSGGQISVRLSDIVYRLQLRSARLELTTLQGRMQIDAFDAAYEWSGNVLRFEDAAKAVRYEIRLGPRQASGR